MASATLHVPVGADAYAAAIEGLTRLDELILHAGVYPALYDSAVRYRKEPREVWRTVNEVNVSGWGDCEDLAAWRAAELRVSGEDPDARVHVYKSGHRRYHAVVQRGSGDLEDPSLALGMRRPKRNPIMSNSGPCADIGEDVVGSDEVTFDIYRRGNGWSGIFRLPLLVRPGGPPSGQALYASTSVAPSPAAAGKKAANLAKSVLNNPALQALLPPQAQMAVKVLQSPQAQAAIKAGAKAAGALRKLF